MSNDIVVTIRIALPSGTSYVSVGEGDPDQNAPIPGTQLTQAQAILPAQFVPQQVIQPQNAIPPKQVCPVHGVSRWVPGGFSKTKTNPDGSPKSYKGFWACDTPKETGCSWKA